MTFSIVARDRATGALGIAIATNPLFVGNRCPFIRSNVAAVATQANTNPEFGPLALDLLEMGFSPSKVIEELRSSDKDFSWRQVGIVDRHGRTAVHTGNNCKDHSSAIEGEGYIVMGNYLQSAKVVADMNSAWLGSAGEIFEERLMLVAEAARDAGGDQGGHRSAALIVYDSERYAKTDLRVDSVPKRAGASDAIDELRRLWTQWRDQIEYYRIKPHEPTVPGWLDWLAARGIAYEE